MKLLMLLILLATGCSNPSDQKNTSFSKTDVIEFEPLTINTSTAGVIPSAALDFASLSYQQSATQSLIISNKSASSLIIAVEDLVTTMLPPFTISQNNCIGSIASRKSCVIEFKLVNSTQLSSEQIVSSSLIIKGATISLTGFLQPVPPPSVVPDVSLSITPSSLQFGTLIDGQIKELSLIVKNNATISKDVVVGNLSSSKISFSSNTCPSSLGSRKTCTIKLKYSAAGDESILEQQLFTISNSPILYSVIVDNPTVETPVVITSVNPSPASRPIVLTQPDTSSGSIIFKNNGSSTFAGPISAVSSHSSISITSISCLAGIVRGRSCTVNYSISSLEAPLGASSQTIKLQSGLTASDALVFDLTISAPGPSVDCNTLSDAELQSYGYITTQIASVSGNTPDCVIETCDPYYERAGGTDAKSCNPKQCSGLDSQELIDMGYIDDASGSIGYNPQEHLSGTYPACSLTCPSGYETNPNNILRCQPVADVITYQPAYESYGACSVTQACQGVGEKSRSYTCQKYVNGILESTVGNSFCELSVSELIVSCQSPMGQISVAVDQGSKQVSCLEGSTIQSYVASSLNCNSGYVANESLQLCEEENVAPSALALLGDGSVLQYGSNYNFTATGGTPPYIYTVTSSVGSVVDTNSGTFTPGDNQQIDQAIDLLKVTDSTGAFVEISLNISNNIQVMYPVLHNGLKYVSSYVDNSNSVSIVIKNAPLNKYLRVYNDPSCGLSQIYESYTYEGDIYASDNIFESSDTTRVYSVSVEDIDPETSAPLFTNVECSPFTVSYVYDITPPEIFMVSATGDGSNTIQLSVSSFDNKFYYYKDLNCTESIGNNNSPSFPYNVGLNPGVFFFTAKVEDEAGNISECSNGGNASWGTMNYYAVYEHLMGDSGLYPIVVGHSEHDRTVYFNQPNIPVYVYGNSIEYESADLFLNNSCSGNPVALASTVGQSPFNSYLPGIFVSGFIYNDENQNSLMDGSYQVYARRGNEQTSNTCSVASLPFVIDTVAPSAPIISLVQGVYNSVGDIKFNIDGMEPNVLFSLGRNCQNTQSGGYVPSADNLEQVNNFSGSEYDYNLANNGGIYRFAVSVQDRAQNQSQCSNLITYEYDNGRPYITDISSSTTDGTYGPGQNINVRLSFNKPIQKVNNSGSISLRISSSVSRNVSLSSAVASGNNLDFTYVVQANDNTGASKISVENFAHSGSIVDMNDNLLLANTKIPDAGISRRLEEEHSLKADGVGPTTGTLAFALIGNGNNYSNSASTSAPVNILTTGTDQGSSIAGYEVAIGSSSSNRTNVLDWTPVGNGLSNLAATGLNLAQTTPYYLSFRSYDVFGNRSGFFRFSGQTFGAFLVDYTPPAGNISFVDDREFGTSPVQTMSINFGAAITYTSEVSDIDRYLVAIGTEPGGTSILNWSNINNHNLEVLYNNSISKRYKVQVTALNLDENTTYYASIKFCDIANNCKEAYGNGFTLKNSDSFNQKNYIKSSNRISNGKFGSAVAIEGNYIVIGAPGEGTGGRVYVYKRIPGTNQLIEEAVLSGSNSESSDEFGASVAISGNRIIVGAPAEDGASNTLSNSGAAYVFKRTSSWNEEIIFRAHNAGSEDRFGDRVKISQLNAAVSALYEDSDHTGINNSVSSSFSYLTDNNNVANSGAVYTYAVDAITQQWSQDAFVKKTNSANCGAGSGQCAESANDNFGFSIDLKGPILAVGTPYHDLAQIGFYNSYIQSGNGGGSNNPAHRSGYPNSGGVYIFHKQSYFWQAAYVLRSPNIDPGDEFGYSIAINELDSTSANYSSLPTNIPHHTIAIGAPGEDHGDFISSVHTDIHQSGGTFDNLTHRRYLTGASSFPIFGATGSTGTFLNNNLADSGAVYIFAFEPIWFAQSFALAQGGSMPSAMHFFSYIKAPNLGAGDRFGSSVGIVGNTTYGWDRIINSSVPPVIQRPIGYLVVGAPKEDNSATGIQSWTTADNIWNGTGHITDNNSSTDSGAVYVFKSGYENTLQMPSNQRTDFVLQQYIKAPASSAGSEFGSQISASVNSWLIGVPLDDANADSSEGSSGSSDNSLSNSGAAYIINNID